MQPNNPYQPNTNEEPQVVVGGGMVAPATNAAPAVSQSAFMQPNPEHTTTQASEMPVPAPAAAQANSHSPVKGVVVGLVAVLLLAGGWGARVGASALASKGAESTGRSEVAALVAGDKTKAYSLASENLKNQETADALVQAVGDVQTTKPAYQDESVQVSGDSAVYVATVDNLPADDSGNTSAIFVVSLSKTGLNSWKVDDVNVQ